MLFISLVKLEASWSRERKLDLAFVMADGVVYNLIFKCKIRMKSTPTVLCNRGIGFSDHFFTVLGSKLYVTLLIRVYCSADLI